jgi:hypothetical protein
MGARKNAVISVDTMTKITDPSFPSCRRRVDHKMKVLTLVGEIHSECGARPNAGDDAFRSNLWHRAIFLEGHIEERRRDVGLSSAEHDHKRRALSPELPLAFVNNVAEIAEIPGAMRVNDICLKRHAYNVVTRLAQAWRSRKRAHAGGRATVHLEFVDQFRSHRGIVLRDGCQGFFSIDVALANELTSFWINPPKIARL